MPLAERAESLRRRIHFANGINKMIAVLPIAQKSPQVSHKSGRSYFAHDGPTGGAPRSRHDQLGPRYGRRDDVAVSDQVVGDRFIGNRLASRAPTGSAGTGNDRLAEYLDRHDLAAECALAV
jgi:hypothetical protein